MKILVTADLHYNIVRSRAPTEDIARQVNQIGGDVLVLVGDTVGSDLNLLPEALRLFADFKGRKLFVPGNHCLWCLGEENSIERYEQKIPELAAAEGFCVLDHSPQTICGVGLVGSIGWYDYSFADGRLGIPADFYRAKIAPGAAEYLGGYDDILLKHRDLLGPRQMSLGTRWLDGMHVRLGMSDEQFTSHLADKLAAQLNDIASNVDRIVAFIHHLPFAQLLPEDRPDRFAFAAAYLGSGIFGDVLLACPKVSHVYCGHSHWPGRFRIGHIETINVGSTYKEKRLEILDI